MSILSITLVVVISTFISYFVFMFSRYVYKRVTSYIYGTHLFSVKRDPIQTGQESVWDYPRPPALQPVNKRITIDFNGVTIADTKDAYRVLETSHPPVYYIPRKDIKMEYIKQNPRHNSFCEWKGQCTYWDLDVNGKKLEAKIFSYENPTPSFKPITGYLSFYAGPMDACYVDGEKVIPQPGNFYSGWITKDIAGEFSSFISF